jgi:hypothetical protein
MMDIKEYRISYSLVQMSQKTMQLKFFLNKWYCSPKYYYFKIRLLKREMMGNTSNELQNVACNHTN